MRKFLLFLAFCLLSSVSAFSQGESRENPILVSSDGSHSLLGKVDANTTTWFSISPSVFDRNNLVSASISGGNYGDIIFIPTAEGAPTETFFLTTSGRQQFKHLWDEAQGQLLIAVSQDGEGGKIDFTFTKAKAGEVRQNAVASNEGINIFTGNNYSSEVWISFTSPREAMVYLQDASLVSNVLSADGIIVCMKDFVPGGFRLQEGQTCYFCLANTGSVSVNIRLTEIPVGYFSDKPLDITGLSSFVVDIPEDPNASSDSSAQSERYWLYRAEQSGILMWGSDDAEWTSGMWGAGFFDRTLGKRLNSPVTAQQAGMVTYTVPVEAGHEYLIEQVIGHGKARKANVYLVLKDGAQGDTRDNPIPLTLGESTDMGRVATTTRYYLFTAPKAGVYTAEIHAGGQVRATTPQDGSWNIGRDYDIQDRHMHIDRNIPLAEGESLLLEITLTSNIDFHVGDADASIPNYSILITCNNDEPTDEDVRDGVDIAHAIPATAGTVYEIWQNGSDGFYPRYYEVQVPAGQELVVTTQHSEAISSPSCISFTLDGQHWNNVEQVSTLVSSESTGKKIGRQYVVSAKDFARTIYLYVEGVSFLYENASWQYSLVSADVIKATKESASSSTTVLYDLQGRRMASPKHPGVYISSGRLVLTR